MPKRKSETKSKYRPVSLQVWNDRRFLSLTDTGKLLWMFLLTTPASLPIPGVIIGGDHALSEQIGWPVERFREGFREIVKSGLRVRRDGRVIWLSNALKHQPPHNPNQIKCWAKCWADIPECELKSYIWEELKTACKSYNVLFQKLFVAPAREPYAQRLLDGFTEPYTERFHTRSEEQSEEKSEGGSARVRAHDPAVRPPSPGRVFSDSQNPEPDPEPDGAKSPPVATSPSGETAAPPIAPALAVVPDSTASPDASSSSRSVATAKSCATSAPPAETTVERDPDLVEHRSLVDDWNLRYRKKNRGASPTWNPWSHTALADLAKAHPPEEIHRRMAIAFEHPPSWPPHPFDVKTFARHFDLFAAPPENEVEKSRRIVSSSSMRNEVPATWE